METDSTNQSDLQVTHFAVRFRRGCRTYYTGEVIDGFIDIDKESERLLEKIEVCFRGETLACWQDDDDETHKQNTIRAHKCHWKKDISVKGIIDCKVINFVANIHHWGTFGLLNIIF